MFWLFVPTVLFIVAAIIAFMCGWGFPGLIAIVLAFVASPTSQDLRHFKR